MGTMHYIRERLTVIENHYVVVPWKKERKLDKLIISYDVKILIRRL